MMSDIARDTQKLSIYDAHVKEWETAFLPDLKFLYLRQTSLTKLVIDERFKNLQKVSATKHNFSTFKNIKITAPNVKSLKLQDNHLSFPKEIVDFSNVSYLNFARNNMNSFDK